MAEITAMSVAETVLKKITPLVQDHLTLIWGLSDELKKLDFLVSLIKAIQDDTRGGDHNRVDQVWLDNLDKIMNEITGVLDYFQRRANSGSAAEVEVSDDSNVDGDDDQKKKKEEENCLSPLSYFISDPNPIVWVRDNFMARKIKTIRQRLYDNLNDKKLLEFHPAVKKKQAPPSSSDANQSADSVIAPSARAWTLASDYIVIIQINNLPEKEKLPSLHNLPRLEELTLEYLTLEYIFDCAGSAAAGGAGGIGDSVPSGKLFPKLRKLWIRYCPNLKGWWKLPTTDKDTSDDQSTTTLTTLPQFPCLELLDIRDFNDLIWFPVFPGISSTLYMVNGSILHLERTRKMQPDSWRFKIQYLWLSQVGDMEYLDIELFPILIKLDLYNCHNLRGWGKNGGKVPSSLTTFDLRNCSLLGCLPKGMKQLGANTTVNISGCDKLKQKYASKSGPDWPSGVNATYLTLDW